MQASTSLLHDAAGHHVLEGLLQLAEGAQTLLGNGGAPLVHLVLLVGAGADGRVDGVIDNFGDVVHHELVLIVIHLLEILTGALV